MVALQCGFFLALISTRTRSEPLMNSFIPLTDEKTGQLHFVSVNQIVRISSGESSEVALTTGELLTVKEDFRRIEGLIRGRTARDATLLETVRKAQLSAVARRATTEPAA